jgi:hypothetical protein
VRLTLRSYYPGRGMLTGTLGIEGEPGDPPEPPIMLEKKISAARKSRSRKNKSRYHPVMIHTVTRSGVPACHRFVLKTAIVPTMSAPYRAMKMIACIAMSRTLLVAGASERIMMLVMVKISQTNVEMPNNTMVVMLSERSETILCRTSGTI